MLVSSFLPYLPTASSLQLMENDEEEEVLTLFDFYWSEHQILKHPPPPPALDPPKPKPQIPDPPSTSCLQPPLHRRSLSDELPYSVALPIHSKLQTILSGKETVFEEAARDEAGEINKQISVRRRRKKKGSSKSLSDLEFEELKGLMDLGFTFSESEMDPRLILIVPGLQRLAKKAGDGGSSASSPDVADEAGVARPYLSEAWEEENPLKNWRIPSADEGVDIKDHLKFWAQAVASTVR